MLSDVDYDILFFIKKCGLEFINIFFISSGQGIHIKLYKC